MPNGKGTGQLEGYMFSAIAYLVMLRNQALNDYQFPILCIEEIEV